MPISNSEVEYLPMMWCMSMVNILSKKTMQIRLVQLKSTYNKYIQINILYNYFSRSNPIFKINCYCDYWYMNHYENVFMFAKNM